MTRRRVLVVDDHALFRRGLVDVLLCEGTVEVVGEGEDGEQAASMTESLRPDLVLMDISMPRCDGIEATHSIKQRHPEVSVVMLTAVYDEEMVLRALRAGADGYLLKTLSPAQLLAKLSGIMKGEASIPGSLAQRIINELRQPATDSSPDQMAVSSRDRQVLVLVAEGFSNREIGVRLCISENTVKLHVKNILRQLGLQNRVQAAVYAVRNGME